MDNSIVAGDTAQKVARSLIDRYFRTTEYPYTRHHIDSYDQFLQKDLLSIIQTNNPIMFVKDLLPGTENVYRYKVEIYVGGLSGTEIEIGTPTISLQNTEEVRVLFPNEARLRNLTYMSTVYANIVVKIKYTEIRDGNIVTSDLDPDENEFQKFPLFKIPIMLHSRYCVLHNKPAEFLRQAGECPYDYGGYFVVNGAEKVLITRQEQSFNTLYITEQPGNPKVSIYASITCLNPKTRMTKRVQFGYMRNRPLQSDKDTKERKGSPDDTIQVSLPMVRKPIPLFVLFRALGYESDEDILHLIYPDFESPEAKLMLPKLHSCILDAFPFMNTFTATQYIKTLTKGFTEETVLDIIRNQLFVHMPNDSASQALFLADCVRKILRVNEKFDKPTDRDDIRNQRCLTSGFLVQMLFNNAYRLWKKASVLTINREYEANKNSIYLGPLYKNIFQAGNANKIFMQTMLTDSIMKGFKGKWGTGLGEEKTGVLQALSRLSYCDFISHCRRVILDFDTGMKLTGPRMLHPSQYGYFCTNETPSGSSIGITKNLNVLTSISTGFDTTKFLQWLSKRGGVYKAEDLTLEQLKVFVPVYVNNGLYAYTFYPNLLTQVLKTMKRSGCLPYSVSVSFSIRDRKVYIFLDEGRPLRPLIWLQANGKIPTQKLGSLKTWRDLVMGTLAERKTVGLDTTDFFDVFETDFTKSLNDYITYLEPHTGAIEYVDPYEHNETYIANYPEYVVKETTHLEVHPSTILSIMTSLIPFPHHNQSPRNQLSDSQSKQGISYYVTNWQNRFDNTAHVLCYGEAPLSRSMYNNYLGDGRMPYGMNVVLAIACWSGYNQEDGIVMNYDALQRGMFRTMAFRSYQAFEEDDEKAKVKTRFANPMKSPQWKNLKPGLDYTKLDEHGFIKEGEYCDENTVIVGAYMVNELGAVSDVSVTPQVWTRGRVEKLAITVNNQGLRLVKIRVVQDRIPELGDKFCLTPDHEVHTTEGWIDIEKITLDHKVSQWDPILNKHTHEKPKELFVFDHTDEVYEIKTNTTSQCVTGDHRVWTKHTKYEFVLAKDLFELCKSQKYYIKTVTQDEPITEIIYHKKNPFGSKVYCLSVPSEIFLVRRKGNGSNALWTGNSNRHGQKGTIGALLRGHDMPRTKDGIVPDMIMNPHAIPSRMTIAQNLEQLLGKTAAMAGAIGDATAFMNDGSPEPQLGTLLEAMGFEKYGNEILYNGATGEQIPSAIFIGPVYGMRLKHMVEDKWQARGKGRREQRTHQPTGGRGQQGGLKIGEMDRDSLIAHSATAFYREAFMNRSDGSVIPICTSCGTIPIYNPRLGIVVCPMCQGPVQFVGETVNNLELLPPIKRPRGKIVNVELPYATTVLQRELETYMNIGMRMITTANVERLRPFELSAEGTVAEKELRSRVFPGVIVPEIIQTAPEQTVTIDQLKAMKADVAALEQQFPNSTVLPSDDNAPFAEENNEVLGDLANVEETMEEGMEGPLAPLPETQSIMPQIPASFQPSANPIVYPNQMQQAPMMQMQQQPMMQQPMQSPIMQQPPMQQPFQQQQPPMQQGGAPLYPASTNDAVFPSPLPMGPTTLVVDVSPAAMAQEGLDPLMMRGSRSRPLRQGGMMMGGQPQVTVNRGGMVPGRMEGDVMLKSSAPITVNKLG